MIQFGNDKIKEIYHGSDKIKEVYHGSDLVWSGKKPSYAILTDDTRIDFELENTPMSNFCVVSAYVTINDNFLGKSNVKSIIFGSDYSVVTYIPNYFIYQYANIESLDLSGLNSVENIGSYFLSACNNLIQFKINLINVPQASYQFLGNSPKISNIYVPMQSVSAYKTTEPWSNHASKIQGY